jgi:hypothetical protein
VKTLTQLPTRQADDTNAGSDLIKMQLLMLDEAFDSIGERQELLFQQAGPEIAEQRPQYN